MKTLRLILVAFAVAWFAPACSWVDAESAAARWAIVRYQSIGELRHGIDAMDVPDAYKDGLRYAVSRRYAESIKQGMSQDEAVRGVVAEYVVLTGEMAGMVAK